MGKVFNVVGQFAFGYVGSLFGPAALAPLGFAIGNLIGGMIFGPGQPVPQSSRLEDLTIQGSEYGATIPVFYGGTIADGTHGGVPTTGNIIDGDPRGGIEEVGTEKSVKTGTGGKKKKQKYTEYNYFLTCAIMFGEGPLRVDKFWADEKVLYDRYSLPDDDFDDPEPQLSDFSGNVWAKKAQYDVAHAEWEARKNEAARAHQGFTLTLEPDTGAETAEGFRFYPGNFKQLPDVALQQFHDGVVPAYRGVAYCVLVKFPLADYNNRVPTFRALLSNGITNKIDMVTIHLQRAGIPDNRIDLREIDGELLGAFQTSQGGARDFVEKIAAHSLCEIAEWDGQIKDVSKKNMQEFTVDPADLSARYNGEEVPDKIALQIFQDEQIPSECNLRFLDYDNNFEPNIAVGFGQFDADRSNILTMDMPIVDRLYLLSPLAQIIVDEAIESRYSMDVSLLPKYITRIPGNGLLIDTPTGQKALRINGMSIGAPGPLSISGRSYNPNVFLNQTGQQFPPKDPGLVDVYLEPDVRLFDIVALSDDAVTTPGVIVASTQARADSYGGARIYFPHTNEMNEELQIIGRATMGVTATNLISHPDYDIDWDHTVRVNLKYGQLGSITLDDLFSTEANTAIIGQNVIRFMDANEVSPDVWDLTGILFGQKGSEYTGTVASGANFLLLVDENGNQTQGWDWVESPLSNMNRTIHFASKSLRTSDDFYPEHDFYFVGNALYPLAPGNVAVSRDPVGLTFDLSWDERTRYDATSWWSGAAGRASDPNTWKVTLTDGVATHEFNVTGATSLSVDYIDLVTWFGSSGVTLSGTIRQVNATTGLNGRIATFSE